MRSDIVPVILRTVLAIGAASIIRANDAAAQKPQELRSTDHRLTSTFQAQPGVLIEATGLKRWTLAIVQDSLDAAGQQLYADERTRGSVFFVPGQTEVRPLRRLPFFPQSVIHQSRSDSSVTVFLAAVEPASSNLLTARKIAGDTLKSIALWPALVGLGRAPFNVLQNGVLASIHARATGLRPQLSQTMRADSAELTTVWKTLDAHRSSEDLATARKILETSPNPYDRIAAIAILSNFDKQDATWHALVGALLDPSELVREHARAVLRTFTSDFTRKVDWKPAAAELHAVLQGSDLFFLGEAMDMLVATGVGPDLAGPLLNNGGNGVLMYAGAQNAWARGPAHRFLRAVSGRQPDGNAAHWRAWIESL